MTRMIRRRHVRETEQFLRLGRHYGVITNPISATARDMGTGDLDTVFREWRVPMVRLAFVITHDESVADEIVQDAFLKLHTAWDHVHNPVGYLRTAVVNGCCSHRRWVGVRRRVALPPISEVAPSPDVADDGLAAALHRLSEPHRVVLALRYFGDLSDDEIASTLGVRPATVRTRVHRALTCLRKEIHR